MANATSVEASMKPLELWGGVECTVNRVGDDYFDQLRLSGHESRDSDLELIAELGIAAIRYPLLWERLQPEATGAVDWSWVDERLHGLRELGMKPIAGLVHHGSGPRRTSLIDPQFAEGLAAFARLAAERYPWIERYTPVNEPLTTARFSGLYGHWYPHARDPKVFAQALLNQCRAVVLAMRSIREVNPSAELVQTEDLGKVFSSSKLQYQADFENERRWLSWDLLCGRVDRAHPMWGHLLWLGVPEREIAWFLDNPCPPSIVGVNYYVTGERHLDERTELFPERCRGGNGRDSYADVEAVRIRPEGIRGAGALLAEAWERFHLPLALTEVHLSCTREEQMRWFAEIWRDVLEQRQRGVDVRAVTAWSLLGAYDWDSLVTRANGSYESGVFDLRSPEPRRTAMVEMLKELAFGSIPSHPVLEESGWWRRPERLLYPAPANDECNSFDCGAATQMDSPAPSAMPSRRPILITGGRGTLAQAFARICRSRGLAFELLSRDELDIADDASIDAALSVHHPWAVVNAAGYVRVDAAEKEPERCFRENVEGPRRLAAACSLKGVRLLTFSSDLVFDGRIQRPYEESDAVGPLNVYGRSKVEAERRVLDAMPDALVVRTSAFFGPWDEYNFVTLALRSLERRQPFPVFDDGTITPTYVPDLVHASLDLMIDGERGLWHLSNGVPLTWSSLAARAAEIAKFDASCINCMNDASNHSMAKRPLYSALGSERGMLMPSLDCALDRYWQSVSRGRTGEGLVV